MNGVREFAYCADCYGLRVWTSAIERRRSKAEIISRLARMSAPNVNLSQSHSDRVTPIRCAWLNGSVSSGSITAIYLLKGAGAELWWFDGDHEAARAAYVEQRRGSIDDFDHQMENISEARAVIETLFGKNRITVLDSSGRYMPESVICARMFGENKNTI